MRLLINAKTTLFSLTYNWKHNISQRADLVRKAVGELDNYKHIMQKIMSEFVSDVSNVCSVSHILSYVSRKLFFLIPPSSPPPHQAQSARAPSPLLPQPPTWHLHC